MYEKLDILRITITKSGHYCQAKTTLVNVHTLVSQLYANIYDPNSKS